MTANDWASVELRHLLALRAVARSGSFSRAAEELGYTQSAISQQIATLEKVVGLPLFERRGGRRQVTLSESGELLLRHAGPIIDRFQSAKADLAAFSEGAKGTLRIGAYESVSARILPAILGVFAAKWPNVEIDLRDSSDKDLLTLVEAGELDLAFVMDSEVLSDGFKTTELLKDPYVLLVPAGSPLADKQPVPVERQRDGPGLGRGRAWRRDRAPAHRGRERSEGSRPPARPAGTGSDDRGRQPSGPLPVARGRGVPGHGPASRRRAGSRGWRPLDRGRRHLTRIGEASLERVDRGIRRSPDRRARGPTRAGTGGRRCDGIPHWLKNSPRCSRKNRSTQFYGRVPPDDQSAGRLRAAMGVRNVVQGATRRSSPRRKSNSPSSTAHRRP